MFELDDVRVGVVGLGYVGLPLAVEFSKHFPVVGYDINEERVRELLSSHDRSREVSLESLASAEDLQITSDIQALHHCNLYIIAVPTPVDRHHRPNLAPLRDASNSVGRLLKRGDVVIYESTVYPGATEEVCVPRLERASGLMFNRDFFVGYSPERINPGDRIHTITSIVKVTSGSTPEAAEFINALYRTVITAGTFKASSLRVAEAAKVIENTQRDVNIAFVNELALIFERLGIDTQEVLDAAATKWNFLPFRPGLVGGHCIGVDPYYLTHKAQEAGCQPLIIPASRQINEGMGIHIASRVIRLMAQRRISPVGARVLVLGFAFKENCPDLRNTRVADIVRELEVYNVTVDVYDPWVDRDEALAEYGIPLLESPSAGEYDAIIIAVAHREFASMGAERIRALGRPGAVLFDVKYLLTKEDVDGRL